MGKVDGLRRASVPGACENAWCFIISNKKKHTQKKRKKKREVNPRRSSDGAGKATEDLLLPLLRPISLSKNTPVTHIHTQKSSKGGGKHNNNRRTRRAAAASSSKTGWVKN